MNLSDDTKTELPVDRELSAAVSIRVEKLRKSFDSERLMSLRERCLQIEGLAVFLRQHMTDIEQALFQDLGKPTAEVFTGEVTLVLKEIRETVKHLSAWARLKRVPTSLALQPARSFIQFQPLGVVLIIAPWNYPVQLLLMPLIGALAAGNCAVLKPSELAPATSRLLAALIPRYVSEEVVQVVEGGIPAVRALLDQPFDHIFFTGSSGVGQMIRESAAQKGIPCTLELGGKSPCLVDESADISHAARHIAWGKFTNAGQICVAPDYVLIHKRVEKLFLAEIKKALTEFYGDDPTTSPDYGRIINRAHYQRIMKLMRNGGDIVAGGRGDESRLYIAPTVLSNVPFDAMIMDKDEEIFGPLLPVLAVENLKEAVNFIRHRPDPLAVYLFSNNKSSIDYVKSKTRSGGLAINATLQHLGVLTLPFGGIGQSGCGRYHGRFSFETFSHQRAVFHKKTWLDLSGALIHPPGNRLKRWILGKIL